MQAVAPYPVSAVVRPAWNDPVLIKRYLDLGAQTLLLPYIQHADDAAAAVRAMRYPTRGIRGVSALTRATRFGRVKQYAVDCDDELCLLVQVETLEAIEELEAIASVDGVHGVFIGPGDLAASMGLTGQPGHPEVVEVIESAIARIRCCGKPAGILTSDQTLARRCIELGTIFTAVGVDVGILAAETTKLVDSFSTRA